MTGTTPTPPPPTDGEGSTDPSSESLPVSGPARERFPFPSWLEVVLMSVALVVLQVCFSIVLAIVFVVADFIWGFSFAENLSLFFLANVLATIPLLAWGWWRSRLPLAHALGFRKVRITAILAIIPLALGAAILLSEIDNVIRSFMPLPNFFEEALSGFDESPFMGLIVLTIIAPWTEEPLFRGLMLGGLARRHRLVPSLLVTAALFSLIHANPAQMPTAFLLGILYGWVFLKTQSLWPCVLAHTIHNALGFAAIYFASAEIAGYSSDPHQLVFQPLWFDMLGLILASLGIMGLVRATRRRPGAGTTMAQDRFPTGE